MRPKPNRLKEVVRAWVADFNDGDPDRLAGLYAPRAVNHQVVEEPVEGREAVRDMFEREFAVAAMACLIENLLEDGEWVLLKWLDPL